MCIAIMVPAGKTIPEEHLRQSFRSNRDGMGLMWPDDEGRVRTWRSMDEIDRLCKMVDALTKKGKPVGIHFRIGTSGTRDKTNCHPFRIHDDLAFIHNGVISIKLPDNKRSDTQVFRDQVLKRFKTHELMADPVITYLVGTAIGSGSKIVFLNGDGEHTIINEKAGNWTDGVWYSNFSYRPYTTTNTWRDGRASWGWNNHQPVTTNGRHYSGRILGDDFEAYQEYWQKLEGKCTESTCTPVDDPRWDMMGQKEYNFCQICGSTVYRHVETRSGICDSCSSLQCWSCQGQLNSLDEYAHCTCAKCSINPDTHKEA